MNDDHQNTCGAHVYGFHVGCATDRFVAPNGINAGDMTQAQWDTINGQFKIIENLHTEWPKNQEVDLLKQSGEIFEEIAEGLEKAM